MEVLFLARDRERTVPKYITDICQNDRSEKLYKKKIHACLVTRQERNFHCFNKKCYVICILISILCKIKNNLTYFRVVNVCFKAVHSCRFYNFTRQLIPNIN